MSRFKLKPWMVLAAVLLLLVIAFFGTFFITGANRPDTALAGMPGATATPAPGTAVEGVVGEVAAPAVSGINGFFGSISDFFARLFALRDIDKEYEAQKIRIQQLTITNQLMDDLQKENERLNKQLGFEEKFPEYEYLPARVTGKEPGSWFLYFTLNRGSNEGVEKEMIVVNELGLVGRVIEIGPTWCKVMAMIDRTSSVSIVVERSRDNGMVHGSVDPQTEDPSCEIFYLRSDADVVVGDRVVTSDFGGSSIKGIPVGVITEVSRKKDLQSKATLVPYVDFSHLENVLIIKKVRQVPVSTGTAAPDTQQTAATEPTDTATSPDPLQTAQKDASE